MDNKIKEEFEKIKAPEELKNETFKLMKEKRRTNKIKVIFNSTLSIAAVAVICLGIATYKLKNDMVNSGTSDIPNKLAATKIEFNMEGKDLHRFKNYEELVDVLKKNQPIYETNMKTFTSLDIADTMVQSESAAINQEEQSSTLDSAGTNDYSKTNTQEMNVDEADIIKTDGKYIYYCIGNTLFIVNCNSMELESKIKLEDYDIREMFLKDNKLVLFTETYKNELNVLDNENENEEIAYNDIEHFCEVIVFNLDNINDPVEDRKIAVSGMYNNSRMIGDTVYFISSKSAYYSVRTKENDLLPSFYDGEEKTLVKAERILNICEPDSSNEFTTICAFDITKNEKAQYETFLGYTSDVYMTEKSMYLVKRIYNRDKAQTQIYKFEVSNNGINYKASGIVDGYINDQFSLSEYNNNLRIVTTENNYTSPVLFIEDRGISYFKETEPVEPEMTNSLYILDENLKELGKLENFGLDEKVYSARFIGNVGYVVTFKQTDPLFVIDLSDPTNPKIKGELKIPGYSSYLHPYDETHIIGFGKNTKENEWGGITTTNIKVSMFDISDLENPQEVFNYTIGSEYASSGLEHNHKVLFENKAEGLIGLPYTSYNSNSYYYNDEYEGIIILKPNFEKNEFDEYFSFKNKNYQGYSYIERIIYVGDYLYAANYNGIMKFNIHNDKEIIAKIELNENYMEYNELYDVDQVIEQDSIEYNEEEETEVNYINEVPENDDYLIIDTVH